MCAELSPRAGTLPLLALLTALAWPAGAQGQTAWSGERSGSSGSQQPEGPPLPPPAEPTDVLFTDDEREVVATMFGRDVSLSLSQDEAALIAARIAELARFRKEMEELAPERRRLMQSLMRQVEEDAIIENQPVSPETIRTIRSREREAERANELPLTPISLAMRTIHHDPASVEPITLRVSPAYVSSIIFLDAAGAPWPIAHQVLGDSSAVTSQLLDDGNGNVAVVQNSPASRFRQSSALIMLRDSPTPITLRVVGDDAVVDARLTVQVPALGPMSDATQPVGDGLIRRDARIMDLLGNPEQDYVTHRFRFVSGDGGADALPPVEALRTDDGRLFVRGSVRLVSPSWTQEAVSEAGMRIYEVPPVHQYIFALEGERTGYSHIHAHLQTKPGVSISMQPLPDGLAGGGS